MRRSGLSARELGALNSVTECGGFRSKCFGITYELNDALWRTSCHALVVYGRRTPAEQVRLYSKGRALLSDGSWSVVRRDQIVTYALPETSPHCVGAALDLAIVHDLDDPSTPEDDMGRWLPASAPQWDVLAALVRAEGLVTGSDFKRLRDRAHFEISNWRELAANGVLRMED